MTLKQTAHDNLIGVKKLVPSNVSRITASINASKTASWLRTAEFVLEDTLQFLEGPIYVPIFSPSLPRLTQACKVLIPRVGH